MQMLRPHPAQVRSNPESKRMKLNSSTAAVAHGAVALILSAGTLAAAPPIFHVRVGGSGDGSSWLAAGGDLQKAIEKIDSIGGGQVWVAAGTYRPNSHPNGGVTAREQHFSLRNGVAVFGGFPPSGDPGPEARDPAAHPTVCSGDIGVAGDATDNVYHVFHHPGGTGLDASARLDGFTVTGGYADGLGAHSDGGGMLNDLSTPTIARCLFTANHADGLGGGAFNSRADALFAHCVFHANNAKRGGGMFNGRSSPAVVNCVFAANGAATGAGMGNDTDSSPPISSCTFHGNRASDEGGAVHNTDNCLPLIQNTILWDDRRGEVVDGATSASTLNSCVIMDGWTGAGSDNLDRDPEFAHPDDPAGADGRWATDDDGLRTVGDSPARDSGDETLLPADAADIDEDGNIAEPLPLDLRLRARIALKGLDRGAYERQLCTVNFDPGSHGTRTGGGDLVQQVLDGAAALAPTLAVEFGWLFAGWDLPFDEVLADLDVAAQYVPAFAAGDVCHIRQGGTGNGTSWAAAAGDLQQAIEVMHAVGGGSVWVAAGTYLPDSHPNGGTAAREVHFSLRNGVAVLGGFPPAGDPGLADRFPALHPTVCSGDIGAPGDAADNVYHVFNHPTGAALDATAVLDGFGIIGGRADVAPADCGGGMLNDGSGPLLVRCHFHGNHAAFQGGGLFLANALPGTQPPVVSCVFTSNTADAGGAVHADASPARFANCVFTGNLATNGAAGYVAGASAPSFTNCTFADNHAGTAGGALRVQSSGPKLGNCILWGNTPDQVIGSGSTNLENCIIQGGWGGSGANNLDADPEFAAPADPDGPDDHWGTADDGLVPAATSPAIDTGNDALLPADHADLDGDGDTAETLPLDLARKPRVRGAAVDRGAYEPLIPLVYHVRQGGAGAGFSWADATGDLQAAIEAAAAAGNCQVWVAAGIYIPAGFPNGLLVPRGEHFSLRNGVPVLGGFPPTGDPGLADRDPADFPTVCSGDLDGDGDPSDNALHVFYHPAAAALDASALLDGVAIIGGNGNVAGHGYGGGMYNAGCSPTLVRCVFHSNNTQVQGGGLYLGDSAATVTNCAFVSNRAAEGGGVFIYQSTAAFANCVFAGNTATSAGGAVHAFLNGAPAFANCTFSGNGGGSGGGAFYTNNCPVAVANSVVHGNTPNQCGGMPEVAFESCLLQTPVPGGSGNFVADPLFLAPAAPAGPDGAFFTADDGLRVPDYSPAMNAGSSALLPPDAADLDGDGDTAEALPLDPLGTARATDGIPEAGAYETVAAGMSLAYWRTLHFSAPDRADPAKEATVWGNDADPEGDGIPNCGEYLLLLDPNACDSPLAGIAVTGYLGIDWLGFTYTRAKDRPGVTEAIQTSPDLAAWSGTGFLTLLVGETATTATYQVLLPLNPPRGFIRFVFTVP